MSEKALKALFGTVLGLGILWLAVSFFPRGDGGSGEPSGQLATFFDGVTPEAVTAFRIRNPETGTQIELSRAGGEWRANGFRADSSMLARLWEAFDNAEIDDLVASNPANHARMGLVADSAWTLELDLTDGTKTLLLGKQGSRYGTAFVRLPGEDDVHLLTGSLRPNLTRSLDDWRNKRVATVDTANVWRIEVERDDESSSLQRSDSLWVMDSGEEATVSAVRSLLGEMARMDATGFYAPGDSLPALAGSIRALDEAGETHLFLEIGSGDGDRWVRVEGDSITYKIPSWRASRIFPDLEAVTGGG